MIRLVPLLLLAGTALAPAQDEPEAVSPARKIPAVSLLPDGSVLEAVMLPRYDANRRLIDVLRASSITLVDADRIRGEQVSMEVYNPDRSRRGRIDLERALFDQAQGRLTAESGVEIEFERLFASGTALVYDFEQGQGFLSGPATTRISRPVETAMNRHFSPLRATALMGISLLALPVADAAPPRLSPEEIARMEADAVSRADIATEAAEVDRRELEAMVEDSSEASREAMAFLKRNGLMHIADRAEKAAEAAAPAKPLEVEPDPLATVIECEDGIYFDAEEGVLVYLKNVRVSDPRMELSGVDELKVFFEKKPEDPAVKKEEEPEEGGIDLGRVGASLGDVSRIVATGAVRVLQKRVEDKEPIEASGAILTYDMKSGEIIISGGFPWVKQGSSFFSATRPNERLRVFSDGSFRTEGFWKMGGRLDQGR